MAENDEDEEEGGAPEAAAASSGPSPIVKWLIYIAGAVFGLIATVIVSMFVAQKTATSMFQEQKNIALVKAPPPLVTAPMDEFRINTADVGETHFVKLKMSLAFEENQPELAAEIGTRKDQISNLINLVIAQKTKEELKGISNQLDLREEIKVQINHILSSGKIKEVYFLEFVIN
jgi:flagellar FliL protein